MKPNNLAAQIQANNHNKIAQQSDGQQAKLIKQVDVKQYEQMGLYKKLKSRTAQNSQNFANNLKGISQTSNETGNFQSQSYLNMSLQKESMKLNQTLQKLKENISTHHINQKSQTQTMQEIMNNPNQSYFSGPIKGSREALPTLNIAQMESMNNKLSNASKQNPNQPQQSKIPIVQKQIVYTRTDSVKSSATTYPHTTQGGSTKVVRLIRGENDDQMSAFGDTNRSIGFQSAFKALNNPSQGTGLVRKIQTPQTFKCKQKPAKRSSQLKGQSQGNSIILMNQSDYNPFVGGMQHHNQSVQNNVFNPFTAKASPQPASRLIYTENKNDHQNAMTYEDNIHIQVQDKYEDDDFNTKKSIEDDAAENKMNFSFAEGENNNSSNNSFGKSSSQVQTVQQQPLINNEYYHTSSLIKDNQSKKATNYMQKRGKKEDEIIKKYGIKKIIPTQQQSKLRQETNTSRQTDRSNNTVFSQGSNYSRKEKAPAKQRSGAESNTSKASQARSNGSMASTGFNQKNPVMSSARAQMETFKNPFTQTQKIPQVQSKQSDSQLGQQQQQQLTEPFNPFKQQMQQVKKPIYGSVSPEKQRQMNNLNNFGNTSNTIPTERSDASEKTNKFKQFQNKLKAYGAVYQ
ncbi:UNKNOWN [Stylonychia lemnae]|uniref:Uncharacterized protein n=1 Tax=Stylonychia lemnae TaxID=5949 RepID=A0A078A3G6_STYLE|nr:UNKNOWN [Stylonychia lemnae]|eukprot:CDW76337.1 UNKNOWN [Stylonychia lemnae]